jgi:hypothetical protein
MNPRHIFLKLSVFAIAAGLAQAAQKQQTAP